MKKKIITFILLALFGFTTNEAYAFTIYEARGTAIKQMYQYIPSKDYYYLDLYDKSDGRSTSQLVMYARYVYYTDEFQNVNTDKTWSAATEGYSHYIASVINCNGYYEIYFLDKEQNEIGYVKMQTTQIKNPPCDSTVDFEDQFPDDERNGSGGNDCICLGIQELKDATKAIRDSLGNDVMPELNSIKEKIQENNEHLLSINSSINDFHEEFKTDKNFDLPNLPEVPEYIQPQTDTYKHVDSNKYFEEPLYDDVPPPLPHAPEPKHWEGFLPERELNKDNELEMNLFKQDQEFNLDIFSQDEELHLDSFNLDIFTQDEEMKKELFTQDEEFSKQEFDLTNQFNQNHFYERNEFYEQTWP